MDFNGSDYLVTSDYYSRWIEIDKITSTTYAVIIEKLSAHFSREGLPQKIRTDNNPRFMSERFQLFLKSTDIQHSTSSPWRFNITDTLLRNFLGRVFSLSSRARASLQSG